nr:EpsG family protein [Vibrio kanaloae]
MFCSAYLYSVEEYRARTLIFIPPFLVYFLIAALQFNVGSDYPSYIYIYENQWILDRYFNTGEYFFYYSNIILEQFKFKPQSIFFVFAFVQSIFIFVYLKMFSRRGGKVWLIFVIFFCAASVYNNQLNGIRQYAVICLVPIFSLVLFEKRYFLVISLLVFASTLHTSYFILFSLPLLLFIYKKFNIGMVTAFILSLPLYVLISNLTVPILELLELRYLSYIDSDYFSEGKLSVILTKVYYIPLILLFYFIYSEDRLNSLPSRVRPYVNFCIFIFSCTYWSFITLLDIALLARIASYFWLFLIFPIYVVCMYLSKRNIFLFGLVLCYIAFPYIAKVTFLAKNEYLYNSFIFN